MPCRELQAPDGSLRMRRYRFTLPTWGPLDDLRLEHDPEGGEPHHLHMRWSTRAVLEPEVVRLLPKPLRHYNAVAGVVR